VVSWEDSGAVWRVTDVSTKTNSFHPQCTRVVSWEDGGAVVTDVSTKQTASIHSVRQFPRDTILIVCVKRVFKSRTEESRVSEFQRRAFNLVAGLASSADKASLQLFSVHICQAEMCREGRRGAVVLVVGEKSDKLGSEQQSRFDFILEAKAESDLSAVIP
jgi:hypothetical protein